LVHINEDSLTAEKPRWRRRQIRANLEYFQDNVDLAHLNISKKNVGLY